MASTQDAFDDVLFKFKSRLSKKELEDFKFSSLDDVRISVIAIQEEQGRRREMMNLTRIQAFLEAMEQYGKVIEVFLNASSILCFVWGPMKFCLQVLDLSFKLTPRANSSPMPPKYFANHLLKVASGWAESFDILLDAYKQLAQNLPLLQQFQALFKTNPQMISVLSMIYNDILEFHLSALRVFKRPSKFEISLLYAKLCWI